jgi:hypothetical protein
VQMKMLAEYLEKAITFEQMAAQEKDYALRASLESSMSALAGVTLLSRTNMSLLRTQRT